MKLASYYVNETLQSAVLADGLLHPLNYAGDVNSLLEAVTTKALDLEKMAGGPSLSIDEVRLAPPVPHPEKIICIGLNYADHAAESGSAIPEEPVVFNKFPTALRSHGEAIELPTVSDAVDYEAELVVVIGREAKHLTPDTAMECVAGYTCGNDVSARDWQKGTPQQQWLCGKSFDSFAPVGPVLVTRDELADPHNLDIQFRLNGEVMQQSNTKQLIFKIEELLSHITKVCTLRPGDLLFTGTPPGVGAARKPPVFLQPGDIAEVDIQGIGVLRNPVVAACTN